MTQNFIVKIASRLVEFTQRSVIQCCSFLIQWCKSVLFLRMGLKTTPDIKILHHLEQDNVKSNIMSKLTRMGSFLYK